MLHPFHQTRPSPRGAAHPISVRVNESCLTFLQDKDAHVGSVRTFSAPSPPQAPALPTDLAGELSAFDAQEPTLGGSAAPAKAAASTEDGGQGVKEWLAFLEADIPKEEAHH